jgi:eukaryotic-like serine/threonine-protein kinase
MNIAAVLSRVFKPRPKDGVELGSYVLVEKLGSGGMGEVWRAKHRSLVRPAAIKLLKQDLSQGGLAESKPTMRRRFEAEVQATTLLTSPHTIAVYDYGTSDDGTLYYVMELLAGLDMETLIKKFGPQPAERVIYFLRQACESLAEAHHRGLIHRDIKPANLYVCSIGMQLDFVKLLDFGLVQNLTRDIHLTAEQTVSGTPAYMAPESASHHRFDARSDLYSLGCVAYWLLTGRAVFEGETSAAIIAAQIYDTPVLPSHVSELTIPKPLEAAVMMCLEKDPIDRPQSAEALSELLAHVAVPEWTQRRAEAWWSANMPDVLAASRTSVTAPTTPGIKRP